MIHLVSLHTPALWSWPMRSEVLMASPSRPEPPAAQQDLMQHWKKKSITPVLPKYPVHASIEKRWRGAVVEWEIQRRPTDWLGSRVKSMPCCGFQFTLHEFAFSRNFQASSTHEMRKRRINTSINNPKSLFIMYKIRHYFRSLIS